jgi:transposase
MIFVTRASDTHIHQLRKMKRKEIGRVSQRAHIVLLSLKELKVPAIASVFEISPSRVRYWLRRFDEEGPGGLYDRQRTGRPKVSGQNQL